MRRPRALLLGLALLTLIAGASGGAAIARGGGRLEAAADVVLSQGARLIRVAAGPSGPVTVTNTADLMAALRSAGGGETIKLAPGVYSDLRFKVPPTFDATVTLTSADPSRPAVVTDFTLSGVRGLRFHNLILQTLNHPDKIANDGSYVAFKFFRSTGVTFEDVKVQGSLDGDPSNDVSGISIRDSRDVAIINSEFQQLERGLAIGQTSGVRVIGNTLHDLRSDGFNFAEVSDVEVVGNIFWNFFPAEGDHPDAIQFWTSRTKTPSRNIRIAENVIHRGRGAYAQGIFLRDQMGTLPYEQLTIADNLVVGTGYNGLRITGAIDLTLTDNELITYAGDNNTFFLIKRAERVTAKNNRATAISFDESKDLVQDGNVTTKQVKDKGRAAVSRWIVGHPAAGPKLAPLLAAVSDVQPSAR